MNNNLIASLGKPLKIRPNQRKARSKPPQSLKNVTMSRNRRAKISKRSQERAPSTNMERGTSDRVSSSSDKLRESTLGQKTDHSNLGNILQTAVLMAQEKDQQIAALSGKLD